jgi:hypothetical protein
MPGVFFGESFANKNMTQVTAAIGANNFRSMAIGIRYSFHCPWNFIIETWPAAT